jgi:hypothetical protein
MNISGQKNKNEPAFKNINAGRLAPDHENPANELKDHG